VATAILVIHSAQNGGKTPTIGAQSVDPKIETLTAALRTIRDHANTALKQIEESASERRAMGWKCTGCGHIKRFTRPVPAQVATPCPKCHGAAFEPC
jgi:rubrerythrin